VQIAKLANCLSDDQSQTIMFCTRASKSLIIN
jgi:hypothetical protein